MRKLIYGFCLALVLFSVAVSGYGIAQLKWLETIKKSPESMQRDVSDLSSRGALILARSGRKFQDKALLFFDNPAKVNGLAIGYWLYPIQLQSISSIVDTSNEKTLKPSESLGEVLSSSKRPNTILFVGSSETLEANESLLDEYHRDDIAQDENGNIFAVLERV